MPMGGATQLQRLSSIIRRYLGQQVQIVFAVQNADHKDPDLKRLAGVYNSEYIDTLEGGIAKCGKCGKQATKKCSRCQLEWYCSRECQVASWKGHKLVCDIVAKENTNKNRKA